MIIKNAFILRKYTVMYLRVKSCIMPATYS